MIEVYKYTHGLYKVSALPVEMEENTTRGHNYKLKKRDVKPRPMRARIGLGLLCVFSATPILITWENGTVSLDFSHQAPQKLQIILFLSLPGPPFHSRVH